MWTDGYVRTWFGAMTMIGEAQAVVMYRLLGMSGFWPVARGENERMVSEKLPAFAAAQQAALMAMMTGQSPDRVAAAWLKPVGARTRSNTRRLSKRRH